MADPRFLNPITILPQIGGITIDRTKRLSESYPSQITDNPVEAGSPINEHIIRQPTVVTMSCEFVDTPSTNLTGSFTSVLGLSKTKFDSLLALKAREETFNFMDGIHFFRNFQFEDITLTKENPKYSIEFQVTMKQVNEVKSGLASFGSFTEFSSLSELLNSPAVLRAAYLAPVLLSTGSVATTEVEPFGILL